MNKCDLNQTFASCPAEEFKAPSNENSVVDIMKEKTGYKINIPAGDPEQLIFDRREDGYYNVTAKVYVTDHEGNLYTAYEKCVAKLPDWIFRCIPLEVIKQENEELFTIEIPED